MKNKSIIFDLQDWYLSKCDGQWEHEYGIELSTLDNPGWTLSIDLRADEKLNSIKKSFYQSETNEDDWIAVNVDDRFVKIACGPQNLADSLKIFLSAVYYNK